MRKFALAFAAMMLLFAGCGKEEGGSGNEPNNPQNPTPTESKIEIAEADKTLNFTCDSGERSISFSTSENWTAALINNRADEWCSVSPTSGNAGFSSIKIAVTANNTPDERSASVQIKSGTATVTIVVTQKQQDALTVTQSRFDIGASGGDITVVVAANVSVQYSIDSSAASWIHPSQGTRAMTTSQFKFTIDHNTTSEKREGAITVYGNGLSETIMVYQTKGEGSGGDNTDPDDPNGGGNDDPNNPNNPDDPNNPGGGDDPDDPNDPNNPGGGDNPEPPETPSIVVSTNNVTLTSAAQSFAVEVSHNVDVTYEISASWLSHADTRAMSTNTFIFNATENDDVTERTATIKFTNYATGTSETVQVTQQGTSAELVVSEKKIELTSEKQSFTVVVSHNVDVEFEISKNAQSWLTRMETRAMQTDTYTFVAAENDDTASRTATITFTNKANGLSETVEVTQAEGEVSAEIMFPDPVFRAYVLEYLDTDKDGSISEEEALRVEWISVDQSEIKSFEGIGYFINLTNLYCRNCLLTSLDVSGCPALRGLYCSYNQLTNLDVSGCPALTELDCDNNQLTTLNISGCTKLKTLRCQTNQLTSLDASGCPELYTFNCHSNQLTSLDVSGCPALKEMSCVENHLMSLNVNGCVALTYLYCSYNQLTSLDVSGCQALESLGCSYNQLTSLNVTGCLALNYLDCAKNQLTSLDVNGCQALGGLYCWDNQLTSLYVSGCAALEYLNCENNQLTSLDVRGCAALEYLYCENNQLTSLDVRGCAALKSLGCRNNQLTSLNVNGCQALDLLYCRDNQLTNLDVTGCSALRDLDFAKNQLTNLDVSQNSVLEYLCCEENMLTSLDVSGLTKLKRLYGIGCYQLTRLDVSGCTALEFLAFQNNRLTSLDVSSNTALEELHCTGNQLTSLDVSNNTALKMLNCYDNQLTSLDINNNTALEFVWCYGNQIEELDLSKTNIANGKYNSESSFYPPVVCVMNSLKRVYLKKGWSIRYITEDFNRDESCIPAHTEIIYVD